MQGFHLAFLVGGEMVTKEEIKKAKEVDLVDLVESLGFRLKKIASDTYAWQEHESFRISRHKGFFWFSRGIGGDNITCIQEMCGCNFTNAVKMILGQNVKYKTITSKKEKEEYNSEKPKEEFQLPKRALNGKRAFAYLVKTRGINPEILKEEFSKKHIYQEDKTGNAVFVGYNKNKAASAALRGVGKDRFVKTQDNSDFSYPYRVGNGEESIYVFESPIDLLSYLSMYEKDEKATYISLYGVSTKAVDVFLEENPRCNTIIICTDNDGKGENVYNRLKKQDLKQIVLRERPIYKDFNEDLLTRTMEKGISL